MGNTTELSYKEQDLINRYRKLDDIGKNSVHFLIKAFEENARLQVAEKASESFARALQEKVQK